jgi:hypothetical protein
MKTHISNATAKQSRMVSNLGPWRSINPTLGPEITTIYKTSEMVTQMRACGWYLPPLSNNAYPSVVAEIVAATGDVQESPEICRSDFRPVTELFPLLTSPGSSI